MNLTELQIQLREMEEHLFTLQGEIERMKPQPEEEKKKTYEAITKIALRHPLNNRTFSQTILGLSKTYISCLVYIILADEKHMEEKLLYLCRLAHSMKCFTSAEEVLRLGMEVDKEYFEKSCYELKKVKDSFLTDTLIIANLTEEADDSTFALITDIAIIMEADKDELRVMALVAKSVLTNDFDNLLKLPVPSENRWMGQFREYIPDSWIKAQRCMCGRYCTSIENKITALEGMKGEVIKREPCKVKKRLQAGTPVRESDVLVEYNEIVKEVSNSRAGYSQCSFEFDILFDRNREGKTLTTKILAPCDGILFLAESEERDASKNELRKYVSVYVVSYFDDYTEFCKQYKK